MTYDITGVRLPTEPGVYLMKNDEGRIIYIGKAKRLKNRIRSYFVKNQNYKTQAMVSKIADIEFVLTDTEEEAFLLESNLIKRYRPMYNIELKDQQRYTYLRVTAEKYPRLLVARRMRTGKFLGDGRVYGPFTHGSSKLLTVGTLRKSFKIRICRTLPKKACLEYHLGNCEAPCEFADAQVRYGQNVSRLESVLKGKKKMAEYTDELRCQMRHASESQEFEKAIEIRDTLSRLGSLRDDQKMEYARSMPDEDYFGIRLEDQTALVMSLKQVGGVIRDRERFSFDLVGDNTFGNFLYQYYTTHKPPRCIVVSEAPDGRVALERLLSNAAGGKISIVVPSRGRRKKMVELVLRNIDIIQSAGSEPGLTELRDALGLARTPHTIECFDISNHGADYAVGAMSRMVDGAPDKSGYRRFKIKTVRGRDDYSMIAEVVRRRYLRVLKEGMAPPDLVLIDGGLGQLHAALGALDAVPIKLSCISLAKREEEVFAPGFEGPVPILRDGAGHKILRHARDEAHRFGVAYNRSLRKI